MEPLFWRRIGGHFGEAGTGGESRAVLIMLRKKSGGSFLPSEEDFVKAR